MTTTQTPPGSTPPPDAEIEMLTESEPPAEATAPRLRIDPRIRERVIEVRREAGRRRLRILLVVSSVLSAAGLAFLAVTSPVLDVDRIQVTGALHVTMAQVRTASGVRTHDHLLFVDTGAAARRIEELPWIARATVKRDLPGTLKVTVVEYKAAAYVRVPGAVMLVARNGHVISKAKTAPAGAIEIRGVRQAPAAGALLAPPDAAGVVAQLPAALAQRVVAVDVHGTGIALVDRDGTQIRLGDTSNIDAKAASALAVLAYPRSRPLKYLDVSTPNRPVSHE
jgi:cell division protein FtsQ